MLSLYDETEKSFMRKQQKSAILQSAIFRMSLTKDVSINIVPILKRQPDIIKKPGNI